MLIMQVNFFSPSYTTIFKTQAFYDWLVSSHTRNGVVLVRQNGLHTVMCYVRGKRS